MTCAANVLMEVNNVSVPMGRASVLSLSQPLLFSVVAVIDIFLILMVIVLVMLSKKGGNKTFA